MASRLKAGQVARTIAVRRAEREAGYQRAGELREQGLKSSAIACQLGIHERTLRHWFERGVAPDVRPPRRRQSDFDLYAAYVLQHWQAGERNGTRIWEEIAAEVLSGVPTHGLSLSLDPQENGGESSCPNA
jgi:hypothetical protein